MELSSAVEALRAAGEPTRLRILALLRSGDLAVGELVQVLGQSQPRLSHHLKALLGAGLVERLPEGSWVFYRTAGHGWARGFLDGLFRQIDFSSGDFAADQRQLETVRQKRSESARDYFSAIADEWDRIRNLHFPNEQLESEVLKAAGKGPFHRVIDLGTGTGRMLQLFAPRADHAEGIDLSHQMLTVARANLGREGMTNARVRQGDACATPFETSSADLVIIHQVLHYVEAPERVIGEAGRILRPGGKLVVVDFAPHELEFLREEHGHRRLGLRREMMQDWADQAGLTLSEPLKFDPPSTLERGLSVHIWTGLRSVQTEEAAA